MSRPSAPCHAPLNAFDRRPVRLAALLLVLLASVATAACGRGQTPQRTSGQTTSASATGTSGDLVCLSPSHPAPAGGCVTQDAATGISLRVTDAYADVTGTLVHVATTNTANYPLSLGETQLALASGYVLQETLGGYFGGPESLVVDEPLPPQDFAPHTQITAIGHFEVQVDGGSLGGSTASPSPTPPWLKDIDHIAVRVPFMISPARSAAYTFHQAPVVEQGIGVQVQSLDVAPSHDAFYGPAGGARIELRFSGLPADLELLSFIRVESQRTLNGGGTSGDHGPGHIELHIPGMTVHDPVMTLLQYPIWPQGSDEPSTAPTVGAAGTVEFEVAWQGSGVPTGQPATLTISGIQRLTGGIDGNTGDPPTLPDYQITLPLR